MGISSSPSTEAGLRRRTYPGTLYFLRAEAITFGNNLRLIEREVGRLQDITSGPLCQPRKLILASNNSRGLLTAGTAG